MPDRVPPEVLALLQSRDAEARAAAWEAFVSNHTRLLLHVARSVIGDPERVMDGYAWLLERLHEDETRRLRGFRPEGQSKFTTWLVVVARRLCVDFLRAQGGRTRPSKAETAADRSGQDLRRRLLALAGDPIDLENLRSPNPGPDSEAASAEVREALGAALRRLPPSDQLLLSLRFEDGLQADAIARVLHLPTRFHVYRRLDTVLRQLRAQLTRRGIQESEAEPSSA